MTSYQPPHGAVPPPGTPPNPVYAPSPQAQPRRRAGAVAAAIGACVAVLGAGIGGAATGAHFVGGLSEATSASAAPASAAPTAEQVRAATVDLCTRWAAGYRAMPVPQNTPFDVIPTVNYIAAALADDTAADPGIRAAMSESLRLQRDHAAVFSREPPRGAIQPPPDWTADKANVADQKVWDLCRGYQG